MENRGPRVPVEQCWEEWSKFVRENVLYFGCSCLDLAETEPGVSLQGAAEVMNCLGWQLLNVLKQAALADEAGTVLDWPDIAALLRDAVEASVREAEREEAEAVAESVAEHEASDRVPEKGPSTVCFDCGETVPISDSWRSTTREVVLCEGCFQKAEAAGRAREGGG